MTLVTKYLKWNKTILGIGDKVASWSYDVAPPAASIPTDYVAYWKFNGNSNDETGTYNGTDVNASYTSTGAKFGEQAVVLPNGGYINTAFSSGGFCDHTQSYTISIWFKTDHTTAWGRMLFGMSDSTGWYNLGVWTNWFFNDAACPTPTMPDEATYCNNVWHHLVYVKDYASDYAKIYMDNTLGGTANSLIDSNGYARNLVFGRSGSYNGYYWEGQLQHCRFYNYALSTDQIAALYNE